jgi:hypothetical protein
VLDLFLLTVPFAVIGAGMAWLISYDELSRRVNHRAAKLEATRRALTALAFLLMLGGIIALIVTRTHS